MTPKEVIDRLTAWIDTIEEAERLPESDPWKPIMSPFFGDKPRLIRLRKRWQCIQRADAPDD